MTARSENLVKTPLACTIAIPVAGLTLLVATGPAIAAGRHAAAVTGSPLDPPAHSPDADAS